MKTAAVICEYNPFHNGHLYQINKIKEELHVDNIIALMSPDFVQRGEPAIIDKHSRAAQAIESGISVVLSMPVSIATSSADLFAYGSVCILDKLGIVDYLVFGAECDSLNLLSEISVKISAKAALDSPEIKSLMKKGMTYAKARAAIFPEYSDILSKPNNILAIEYIKSLNELNSNIKPYLIRRKNSDYNNDNIKDTDIMASASAIRNLVQNSNNYELLKKNVPQLTFKDLLSKTLINTDDFSSQLVYKLLSENDFTKYSDVDSDLSDKIKKNINSFTGFSDFIELIKSKDLTYSRISRGLLHILLNIKGNNDLSKQLINKLSFIRILALNREASYLIKNIKEKGFIQPISSVPDNYSLFNDADTLIFNEDLFASQIYSSASSLKAGQAVIHDYSKPVIIK